MLTDADRKIIERASEGILRKIAEFPLSDITTAAETNMQKIAQRALGTEPIHEGDYYQKSRQPKQPTVKQVSDRLIAENKWDGLISALITAGISEGWNRHRTEVADLDWYGTYFPQSGESAPIPRGLTAKRLYEMSLIAYELVPNGADISTIEEMMVRVGRIAAI